MLRVGVFRGGVDERTAPEPGPAGLFGDAGDEQIEHLLGRPGVGRGGGEYREYPGRDHGTAFHDGWEGVADDALDWTLRALQPAHSS